MRAFWILTLCHLCFTLSAAEFSISADEQKILELTNKEREKAGAPALKPSEKLFLAARGHSKNMARQNTLSHELDGKQAWDRVEKLGYKFTTVAENVAHNQSSPKAVLKSWMESPGHRENILNKKSTEIGIGIAKDEDGKPYYTQVFAKPSGKKKDDVDVATVTPNSELNSADSNEVAINSKPEVVKGARPSAEVEKVERVSDSRVITAATFTIYNLAGKTAMVTLPSGSTSLLTAGARGTYKLTAFGNAPAFSVKIGAAAKSLMLKDGASYKLEIEDGNLEVWMKAEVASQD